MEWGGGVAEGHLGHALHHLVHGLGATGVCCVRCHHYDHCTSNTQLCPTQRKFMQWLFLRRSYFAALQKGGQLNCSVNRT